MLSEEVKDDLKISVVQASLEEEDLPLWKRVEKENRVDETFNAIRIEKRVENPKKKIFGYNIQNCEDKEGVLWYREKLAVLAAIVTDVIREIHESKETRHSGRTKTRKAIANSRYYISNGYTLVGRFLRNCHVCRRTKPVHQLPAGLLQPLPIPERPWQDISMDFVTGLPTSEGYNAILVVVDQLSKERYYIPCTAVEEGTTSEETAKMLYKNV
ncbi:hypothetical protein EPUS_09420 [Endocarpon pusillum Z07020]|uniref:Integrase zinc-binding domain-containing protein n=1 Tax=Endocarpon pusillum (strain Z07020 / HMAS-L-300199) TaxID=1263415 RepID=U1HTN3_ENDPU|nr:uncharacterized protein EPUS_09420 [Endocarpon pusillum Z07020]ERF73970.1 hypothetical protein EPUS_09420 [Endocarpon pusillum Z07020]